MSPVEKELTLTNILLGTITLLLAVAGYFAKDIVDEVHRTREDLNRAQKNDEGIHARQQTMLEQHEHRLDLHDRIILGTPKHQYE
jgi:sensor domain CHASE-containing protein